MRTSTIVRLAAAVILGELGLGIMFGSAIASNEPGAAAGGAVAFLAAAWVAVVLRAEQR